MLERWCGDGKACCTAEELSLCIVNLAGRLGLVKSTISHHLKALDDAGLITLSKKGRHNDFTVNRELLKQAAAYLERLAGCCETAICCSDTKKE